MPLPKNRSTSVRKIFRKTPQGSAIAYRRRVKGNVHACGICGCRLAGTTSVRNKAASTKTPSRKFGGNLCAKCASKAITYRARLSEGAISKKDVELSFVRYV